MTTIATVIDYLEQIAPPGLQESYDNARLICGNPQSPVTGIIVSLDAIEAVVDEAIAQGANLVVSHHPIVFSGLKSLTGKNYIERTIIKAIKHDIALYAIHTNLDNVRDQGVNAKLAQVLGLQNTRILSPKQSIASFAISCPALLMPEVKNDIDEQLGAQKERFSIVNETTPQGISVVGPEAILQRIVQRVCRQYNVSYHQHAVTSSDSHAIGAGMIGELALPMAESDFLQHIKTVLHLDVIRHTALLDRSVSKVAICGGAGSFLLGAAMAAKADFFITADYKYHQFFDADGRIVIADVGHFESEQFTIDLLVEMIQSKFSNFAARSTNVRTNPVHYFA